MFEDRGLLTRHLPGTYAGAQYCSLSAVASAITGTYWNGPKFFGLREDEGQP